MVTPSPREADRLARATLMRLAEPGDPFLGYLLARLGAPTALTLIREADLPTLLTLATDYDPTAGPSSSDAAMGARTHRIRPVGAEPAAHTAVETSQGREEYAEGVVPPEFRQPGRDRIHASGTARGRSATPGHEEEGRASPKIGNGRVPGAAAYREDGDTPAGACGAVAGRRRGDGAAGRGEGAADRGEGVTRREDQGEPGRELQEEPGRREGTSRRDAEGESGPRRGSAAARGRWRPVDGSAVAGAGDAGGPTGNGNGAVPGRAGGRRIDVDRLLAAWRARLELAEPERDLAVGAASGARLIVPGDVEWPTQLDDLGYARPYGLWLRGNGDLRFSCLKSVAIVGSRAATAYGAHVAAEFGASLCDAGWTVVSGGAYGIDGAAHRSAVAGEAPTVVVLACATDVDYPLGHHDLFRLVRENGLLVSECPPGVRPTRLRFLVRNRLIAALTRGTIVVEAALRSGALNTVTHAVSLRRPVGAVPGPVTSATSAGCHQLIRQGKAVCVTTPEEVVDLVGAIGDDLAPRRRGPVLPRDELSATMRQVLDAVPARKGVGPATIAVAAGVDLSTALTCLGGLAAAGYVERSGPGWRLRSAKLY